ncbi:MAG: cell wall hydrolase [Deltaproteobacteria bacterium]
MKKYKIIAVFIIAAAVCIVINNLTVENWNVVSTGEDTYQRYDCGNGILQTFKEAFAVKSPGKSDMASLMARAINGEARGEPYVGQVAVGAVILNRTENAKFPKTVPGVIYQPGAFTAVSDGQINLPISGSTSSYKAARDALNGWDPTGGCIYYFNPSTATSKWIWGRPQVTRIGKHVFAK